MNYRLYIDNGEGYTGPKRSNDLAELLWLIELGLHQSDNKKYLLIQAGENGESPILLVHKGEFREFYEFKNSHIVEEKPMKLTKKKGNNI